jgi:hypothetical protein
METMEVYIGKTHTDSFECGLCELNFNNSEELETHINTCKVCRCKWSNFKETNIPNIKSHIEKKLKNEHSKIVQHLKMC